MKKKELKELKPICKNCNHTHYFMVCDEEDNDIQHWEFIESNDNCNNYEAIK